MSNKAAPIEVVNIDTKSNGMNEIKYFGFGGK